MTVATNSGSLCLACGLCCDGSIFARVPLAVTDEIGPLVDVGCEVSSSSGGSLMQQPCAAHYGGVCSVYDHRPAACRAYSCRLLGDVEAGNLEPADALLTIGRVTALRDRLAGGRPTAARGSVFLRTAGLDVDPARLGNEEDLLDTLMDLGEMVQLIERHFHRRADGTPPGARTTTMVDPDEPPERATVRP